MYACVPIKPSVKPSPIAAVIIAALGVRAFAPFANPGLCAEILPANRGPCLSFLLRVRVRVLRFLCHSYNYRKAYANGSMRLRAGEARWMRLY